MEANTPVPLNEGLYYHVKRLNTALKAFAVPSGVQKIGYVAEVCKLGESTCGVMIFSSSCKNLISTGKLTDNVIVQLRHFETFVMPDMSLLVLVHQIFDEAPVGHQQQPVVSTPPKAQVTNSNVATTSAPCNKDGKLVPASHSANLQPAVDSIMDQNPTNMILDCDQFEDDYALLHPTFKNLDSLSETDVGQFVAVRVCVHYITESYHFDENKPKYKAVLLQDANTKLYLYADEMFFEKLPKSFMRYGTYEIRNLAVCDVDAKYTPFGKIQLEVRATTEFELNMDSLLTVPDYDPPLLRLADILFLEAEEFTSTLVKVVESSTDETSSRGNAMMKLRVTDGLMITFLYVFGPRRDTYKQKEFHVINTVLKCINVKVMKCGDKRIFFDCGVTVIEKDFDYEADARYSGWFN